jgi:hypothetical protein
MGRGSALKGLLLRIGRHLFELDRTRETMNALDAELDAALRGVEAGFHVRLISTFEPQLVWAPADTPAEEWLAASNPDFDQFPVRDGDATVGLLLRGSPDESKMVREAMLPLRDGMIVSADTPITDVIPALKENHCRLVLRGGRINGLVTQSDLLKLPVRMLLFGLITHLEICLRALVRRRSSWPDWLERLPTDRRRRRVREAYEASRAERLDPDPLEFTNLSDVVSLLSTDLGLDSSFEADMRDITRFRNDIAHAHTYVRSSADVQRLVTQFTSIRCWIQRVSEITGSARQGPEGAAGVTRAVTPGT